MCNTPSPFNGNISVTDCMPLSSLIKTSKINGCVKCRWCEKIAILDDYQVLPSITAGVSRVINIRMVQYSLYHTSVTRHWASVYHTNRGCQRQTVQKKNISDPLIWTPQNILPSKVDKPTSGTELYLHAKFHTDQPKITVPD